MAAQHSSVLKLEILGLDRNLFFGWFSSCPLLSFLLPVKKVHKKVLWKCPRGQTQQDAMLEMSDVAEIQLGSLLAEMQVKSFCFVRKYSHRFNRLRALRPCPKVAYLPTLDLFWSLRSLLFSFIGQRVDENSVTALSLRPSSSSLNSRHSKFRFHHFYAIVFFFGSSYLIILFLAKKDDLKPQERGSYDLWLLRTNGKLAYLWPRERIAFNQLQR